MADQEETPNTGTSEETPAPVPTEGGDQAPAPDADKPPTPEAAGGEQQAEVEAGATQKTEEAEGEKQPEPTEQTTEAGEQKQEPEGGEPDDKNVNATEEGTAEVTEGGQEQGETEQAGQAKEEGGEEGEKKEEEQKQEAGEGEAGETQEKQGEGEPGAEGEGQTAEVTEGEGQTAEVEGQEKQEVEGQEKQEGEGEGEQKQEEAKEGEEGKEGKEGEEVSKSPVPQSDTFGEGERAESPVGVGQKLTPPGSPKGEVQVPVPDILEPGTPERSRPGSADEDREDGQHLAPFDEEDEEEDEEDDEEEEEQPEFDREELIERYHQAIAEREQLQQQNYQLQHKLADYFRKKKADESKQEYDKNVTDQEQRYLKYMAQLEDLRRQDMQERDNYKHQIEELKSRCEDRKQKVDQERQNFMEFKKQVAQNSLNSRSGRAIAPKDIEQYLAGENRKESEVVNVRLENIKLKNKLKKKEHQLKSKEELAEGLHLIDFEQLKIENQTYNEKIEERNEELLKLRKKITSTVQVLTHLKEKLQYVQAENQVQKRNLREVEVEVAQKRDILSRTKQARDALRIDNQRLRQNSGLLGNEPLLRDFEERKDEGDDLRTKLERLKMQHAELTLHCNQVRRKIEQARNGRA